MQQWRPENPPAMTFDEVSIERSKSFVKALQELKNLRPQLYSAAEYCEKSYLHNEQKQMLLDNLKDYTVRALVNAVDHLGTVAYKLTDLLEQQTLDISTIELKISCMNQQILTCQTYTEKEGLRQHQMSVNTLRHHKHYILPDFVSKTFQNNLQQQRDATTENHIQTKPRPYPSGTSASKTLSWFLASENNSAPNGTGSASSSIGDYSKDFKTSSEVFHLMDTEETAAPLPLSTHRHSISNTLPNIFGVMDTVELSKTLSSFSSIDNRGRHKIYQPPARSKSMLSMLFAKNKAMKPRKVYA